jgi:hypothetical protein
MLPIGTVRKVSFPIRFTTKGESSMTMPTTLYGKYRELVDDMAINFF